MEYGVIAVAALGVVSGMVLKLRFFLVVVGLLLVGSVGFSAYSEISFIRAAMMIIGAQFVLQLCYVVGVKIALVIEKSGRRPYVF